MLIGSETFLLLFDDVVIFVKATRNTFRVKPLSKNSEVLWERCKPGSFVHQSRTIG